MTVYGGPLPPLHHWVGVVGGPVLNGPFESRADAVDFKDHVYVDSERMEFEVISR